MGIEPTTYSLGSCRSTTELRPPNRYFLKVKVLFRYVHIKSHAGGLIAEHEHRDYGVDMRPSPSRRRSPRAPSLRWPTKASLVEALCAQKACVINRANT
jgi:hypothetical protein